ncbi:MAG TPA: GTP cyclohydrolase I FolE [Xanthobacteraceae bacterium]
MDAEEAIRTLIRWMGDDPCREGLRDTPSRVLRAYEEWFAGYLQDPAEHLARTFEEVHGYDEPVLIQGIPFQSWCEHHLAPITGLVHIGYFPDGRVVGLSKLARVVDTITKRLQTQERMTAEIAEVIEHVLQPRGVAVRIDAQHACMSTRGVQKHGVLTSTSKMLGLFQGGPFAAE